MLKNNLYPFAAVVGQEEAKRPCSLLWSTAEQAACS